MSRVSGTKGAASHPNLRRMVLAELLASRRADIVERFAQSMRDSGLGKDAARSELISHISFLLADLEETLVAGDADRTFEAPSSKTARVHGRERYGLGFDLGALVREYGYLRRAIVSVAGENGVRPTPRELDVLATAIDVALAEAASGYATQRDTELIAERDALALERARLEDAVRFREDVVSIVSHDLRSPLTAIALTVRQLSRLAVDPSLKARRDELLATIQRAGDRMTRLIADLLDVATIDAGTLEVEPVPTSATSLLADAVDDVKPLAEQKSIEIVVRAEPPDLCVIADRERMLQVLANLLGNAVKFTPDNGRVDAEIELHDDEVRFSVRDSGPGIPRDQLPHVFDRFYQGTLGKRRGAGLGLAIAKGILEAHRRPLEVQSDEGKGATFSFTLPLHRVSRAAAS
ncbi:MAG: sensor histidine kinase [Polyangiales bacterium]